MAAGCEYRRRADATGARRLRWGATPVNRVEHLLAYLEGQLASRTSHVGAGIQPVLARLALLSIHIRERQPSVKRTVGLAAEVLSELACLLAAEAALGTDETVDLFRNAVDRPDQPRSLDLRAARADLSVAMDHAMDLGRAVLDLAAGKLHTERSLIDSAAGVAGGVFDAVLKSTSFDADSP